MAKEVTPENCTIIPTSVYDVLMSAFEDTIGDEVD